jgi:phosphoglycerate dehydrogenase-like enzyme
LRWVEAGDNTAQPRPTVINVLKNKQIADAAIDVFDIEQLPPSHPFRTLDSVLAARLNS